MRVRDIIAIREILINKVKEQHIANDILDMVLDIEREEEIEIIRESLCDDAPDAPRPGHASFVFNDDPVEERYLDGSDDPFAADERY